MLRPMLTLMSLACTIVPADAWSGVPDRTNAELPACVTLPPMAKGKKCRELPTMAAPEDQRNGPRRARELQLPPPRPQPVVAPQMVFGRIG